MGGGGGGGGGGGNNGGHARKTTAYQIITRHPHYQHDKNDTIGEDHDNEDDNDDDDDKTSTLFWDSGKVDTPDGLPDVVLCTNDCVTKLMSKDNIGIIVEWKVIV